MIMSYTTTYYHIVFRTYKSEQTIPIKHEKELYAYFLGIVKNLRGQVYRIGGMPVTTFAEEYRAFLMENGIAIDERYFLNDTL